MSDKVLHCTSGGLRRLLADLYAIQEPNEVPAPVKAYPASAGLMLKVELDEGRYKRLLERELKSKYDR